jgi:flagellar biosynthesis/type III secretory pathway protein FliH
MTMTLKDLFELEFRERREKALREGRAEGIQEGREEGLDSVETAGPRPHSAARAAIAQRTRSLRVSTHGFTEYVRGSSEPIPCSLQPPNK